MEEYDEETNRPDDRGVLDMSHRAWRLLDDSIWGWFEQITVLNFAYNDVETIPEDIGALALLMELNCAHNKLSALPEEIGKCQRLKKVLCEGNKLDTLPDGLGNCQNLEEIHAASNAIQEIPASLERLGHLETLNLPNNKLKALPLGLYNCVSLTTVDVSGNATTLSMVPEELATNCPMVLWICRQFALKQDKIDELEHANDDLEHASKEADDERAKTHEEMVVLRKRNRELLDREPRLYMGAKLGAKKAASKVCTIM